jgi:hypothetical protein
MKWFFSNKALIIVSYTMMLGGLIGLILGLLKILAKEEPPIVLAISWLALVFAGYGNILTAVINKNMKGDK